jgi:Domain of unknown function (DUF397)
VDPDDLRRAEWRTSAHSGGNGSCVEVATLHSSEGSSHMIMVRDSKDRQGPVLAFAPAGWRAFTNGIKAGEFDPA